MKTVLKIAALLAVFAVMAYPLVWMIGISLRTGDGVSLRYFKEVWQAGPFDRYFLNSVVVTAIVLAGNIVFCAMAGYAFARYRIPGGRVLFFLVVSMIMLPKQVILVPLYILMQKLHLIDTLRGADAPVRRRTRSTSFSSGSFSCRSRRTARKRRASRARGRCRSCFAW